MRNQRGLLPWTRIPLVLLSLAILWPTNPLFADSGLKGEYFDTETLQPLMTTRTDPFVDFTGWSSAPTGTSVTADGTYSERWTGFVRIDTAGSWTFTTNSNDGARLWVDSNQIINNWTTHAATENSGTLTLNPGWYSLQLEHFQQGGAVVIQLFFAGPGRSRIIIPSSHLSTTDPGSTLADAGSDQSVVLPANCATLIGSGTVPAGRTLASYQWSQVSGPSTATLAGSASSQLTACGLVQGTYVMRLTVTDSAGDSGYDEASIVVAAAMGSAVISGELKKWHNIAITFDGPVSDETAVPSPFLDYRLQVTFNGPGGKTATVPGYFAADGNAAETGATGGQKWRVHFVPDATGNWSYVVSFRAGTNIAVDTTAGTSVAPLDGATGTFSVGATDKTGRDLRGKGLLRYVGGHHLQFAETGEYYLKGGADSPENFLGYADFDGTFDTGGIDPPDTNFLHSYPLHVADWVSGDPTWRGTRGKGIIGALNYLSSKGMNSVYLLTYNVDGGDGRDTWVWTSPTERYRFDVSKLSQWEIVFSHMDKKGIQLHLVTQETENDGVLDGGNLGTIRKLYYRELIARFSHHLALEWNIGEENTNTDSQRKAFAQYIRSLDPYDHPIAVHTLLNEADTFYNGLLGDPNYEAASLQGNATSYNQWAINLRTRSAAAGRKWSIYGDEQDPAVDSQLSNLSTLRKTALWGNLMGGGAGVEWYFGYQTNFGDLTSEDWRVTDALWQQTKVALDFFQNHLPFSQMTPNNSLASGGNSALVLAATAQAYAVYLPSGGTTSLSLPAGGFTVKWYNPRTGGTLLTGIAITSSGSGFQPIGNPPSDTSNDWAALVKPGSGDTTPPGTVENLHRTDTL